jgi:general secretion pathway protein J
MKHHGYTLIEVMIALFVFAILATITAGAMMQAFNTRAHVDTSFNHLNKLQLAVALLTTDTQTMIERSVRGNEMRVFPPFTGQETYFEFTRDGLLNPEGFEQRSSLKRIAYLCLDGQLIRRSWPYLDTPNRHRVQDKILLSGLKHCHFAYLTHSHQILNEWRAYAVQQNQKKESLPLAIQVNLDLEHAENMSLLFAIPEALYAD